MDPIDDAKAIASHLEWGNTKIIIVHGNIGVGKTHFLIRFGQLMRETYEKQGIRVFTKRETFANDAILEDVYKRSKVHLFEFQLQLLHHHVKQMNFVLKIIREDMRTGGKSIILLERSVIDSKEAFYPLVASKLHEKHDRAVIDTRTTVINTYEPILRWALHVFITSPEGGSTALEKIVHARNLAGDAQITADYLEELEDRHMVMWFRMRRTGYYRMLRLDCEKPFTCIDFWGYMNDRLSNLCVEMLLRNKFIY